MRHPLARLGLRRALLAVALMPLGLLPRATAGPPPDAGEIQVAEIIEKLKSLEGSIEALSVKATCKGVVADFAHRDVLAPLTNVETTTVERSGRVRCEIDGQAFRTVDGKAVVRPSKSIRTYDGALLREASGITSLTSGRISKSPDGGMSGWSLNPFEVATLFHAEPVSQILVKRKGKVVGRAEHDGRDVLVVETDPITTGNHRWNYRFLIDPALNDAVVSRGQVIQFLPHERWMEVDTIDSHDHREVKPGVWLPSRVQVRSLAPTEEDARTGKKPRVAWEWDVRAEGWAVNPRVEDSLFVLRFPPGTVVEDQTDGRVETIPLLEDMPRHYPSESLVGKPAPGFPARATWLNGNPLTWDSLRGKVVVLDFFAEWCGPCRADYPQLGKLHEERGANGLTIVGVHPPGSDVEAIRKVADEFHLAYPICIDRPAIGVVDVWGEFARRFRIEAIPYAVVVDGRGVVVATGRLKDVLAKAAELTKAR